MSAALERTAAFVAMAIRSGLVKKPTRVPHSHQPRLIEAEYARELVKLVAEWRDQIRPLLEELPALLQSARAHRGDGAELQRRTVLGLDVLIENPAGSVRRWVDSDGTEGSTTMRHDYGCFVGVRGADGEDVDVYIGPDERAEWVYVVHQRKKSSGFVDYDEDKAMVFFASANDAKAAYLAQYDNPRFFGGMTVLSREDFVARMRATDDVGVLSYRLDSSPQSYRVRNVTNRARSAVTSTIQRVPIIAVRTARRAADFHKQQFARQTAAALGISVPTLDTGLDQRIQHFIHANVTKMQALGEKAIGEVESILAQAFVTGEGADDVAAAIMRRFDIAERHARFIARDQVQRLYAQVTRMRHKEVGVAAFMWKTMKDGNVRSSHAVKSDRVFPYEGSRAPSFFPGDDHNCRCWEEPWFEQLKARVRELVGKGRQRAA